MGDLVYHLRRTSDWPQVEELDDAGEPTGSMRDATENEILNRFGMRPVSQYGGAGPVECEGVTVRPGDYLWDCVTDEEDLPDLPGEKLCEGRQSQVVDGREDAPEDSRYQRVRGGTPGLADHVHEAVLYRDDAGGGLRSAVAQEVGGGPSGNRGRPFTDGPGDGADPPELVEEARDRAADESTSVHRRRAPASEVRSEDVVEQVREPGGFAR